MNSHDRFNSALDHARHRGVLVEQARQAALARGVSPVLCPEYKAAQASLYTANQGLAAAAALL